jgi:hypothetical protein
MNLLNSLFCASQPPTFADQFVLSVLAGRDIKKTDRIDHKEVDQDGQRTSAYLSPTNSYISLAAGRRKLAELHARSRAACLPSFSIYLHHIVGFHGAL